MNIFYKSHNFVFFLIIFLNFLKIVQSEEVIVREKCEGLRPIENVDINCVHHSRNKTIPTRNDCTDSQEIGTVAKYKCKPYYIPYDGAFGERASIANEIRCGRNGNWIDSHRLNTFRCVENCGKRLVNPKPFIIGGNSVNRTSWPWHVAIFIKKRNQFIYICGGSIIRNGVILTAAHCVTATTDGRPENPNLFRVVVGTFSSNFTQNLQSHIIDIRLRKKKENRETQILEVQNIFISNNYDAKKDYQADIAILHLRGHITFSDYAIPVCLPNDYAIDFNAVKPGKYGDIVGFGIDETGQPAKTLKHTALKIISHTECFDRLKQSLSESQFCAGNLDGLGKENIKTVCNGDSGGGLVYPATSLGKYYIHGIVSTGGSQSENPCENYGVFTRVFQFIFWIRDILEQINGDLIHELSTNTKYPFILRGRQNETQIRFLGIPREWDHRIESIELSYVDIEPALLMTSLEYTKTLESLNLTQVKFDGPIETRVRLPYLKNFVLNQVNEALIPRTDYSGLKFSFDITKEYIKSLIFFDKEYDEDEVSTSTWPISRIIDLQTNIQLTTNIFKLITINHEEGKICLSHIPFSHELLDGVETSADGRRGFQLKYLALGRTDIGLDGLLNHVSTLKTLVLNEVRFPKGQQFLFTDILKQLVNLEELRTTWTSPFFEDPKIHELNNDINLVDLPRGLKQLSLDRQGVLNYYSSSSKNKIVNINFPSLETFACSQCNMTKIIWQNLHIIFPNIKQLVLGTEELVNLIQILASMEQLEEIYIRNYASYDYQGLKNFVGLQELLTAQNQNYDSLSGSAVLRKSLKSNTWTVTPISTLDWERLNYYNDGRFNFWISADDYNTESSLSSYELTAYKSGHYVFNGEMKGTSPLASIKYNQPFVEIPDLVQTVLTTIEITNAEVLPEYLLNSMFFADKLISIKLLNVKLLGNFDEALKNLRNVQEFTLHRLKASLNGIDYVQTVDSNIFNSLIPFNEFQPDGKNEHQSIPLNYASSDIYSKSHVNKFDLAYDGCTLFYLDKQAGELISAVKFTPSILGGLSANVLPSLAILKLALRHQVLNNLTHLIPINLRHLNLQTIYLRHNVELSSFLSSLKFLQDLRIADLHTPNGNRIPPTLDLSSMMDSSALTLEYLELKQLKLSTSSNAKLLKLPQLKILHIEKCSFEPTVVKSFSSIFPAKQLVLLLSKFNPNSADIEAHEEILLGLLNRSSNSSISWIYTTMHHYDDDDDVDGNGNANNNDDEIIIKRTPTTRRLETKLKQAGVPLGHQADYFIIEKVNGVWSWFDAKGKLDSYLPAAKWTRSSNFGTNSECQGEIEDYVLLLRSSFPASETRAKVLKSQSQSISPQEFKKIVGKNRNEVVKATTTTSTLNLDKTNKVVLNTSNGNNRSNQQNQNQITPKQINENGTNEKRLSLAQRFISSLTKFVFKNYLE